MQQPGRYPRKYQLLLFVINYTNQLPDDEVEHIRFIRENVDEKKINDTLALLREHNKDCAIITTPWDDIDGKVVSYEIHQVKPDRGIYETLLNRFSLKPEECIFFDDRKENTDTAKAMLLSDP